MPFFSAHELFKLRSVCGEWKDLVGRTWHIIFKREMFEQLLSKDLYRDIIQNTKLVIIIIIISDAHKDTILPKNRDSSKSDDRAD
jgi:hypothetical protein